MGNWCGNSNDWVAARCGVNINRIYIAFSTSSYYHSAYLPFPPLLSPTVTTLLLMPESMQCCWGCLVIPNKDLFIHFTDWVEEEEEEGEVMIMVLW